MKKALDYTYSDEIDYYIWGPVDETIKGKITPSCYDEVQINLWFQVPGIYSDGAMLSIYEGIHQALHND